MNNISAAGISELFADIYGLPVSVLLAAGRIEEGILRGVGDGWVCVDLAGEGGCRVFFAQTTVIAISARAPCAGFTAGAL